MVLGIVEVLSGSPDPDNSAGKNYVLNTHTHTHTQIYLTITNRHTRTVCLRLGKSSNDCLSSTPIFKVDVLRCHSGMFIMIQATDILVTLVVSKVLHDLYA